MQNSVSDGEINMDEQPNNNDTPTGSSSYDEVFPALSTPSAAPPPQKAWSTASKLRVGSSTVTQHFVIPRTDRRLDNSEKFGESDSVRSCTQIQLATNTKIEISEGRDQALTFLVTGKTADVAEAQRRITANFQQPSETKIEIPKEYHRKLLGKGGTRLRELEQKTGCRISVPNMNDASETISINGPRDGVDKAHHEIKVTCDQFSKQSFDRVTVPKMYHPFINGPFNETVQKWQNDLSVRINVPPPAVSNDEITIAGPKEPVQAAKEAILNLYQEMAAKCKQVSVEVPKMQHKYVVGPKGSFIHEILKSTGVAVEMPNSEDNSDTITLRGPQEKLGQALQMVCDKSTSIKTVDIDAPAWLHNRLRGKRGANITKIVGDDPSVRVKFEEDKIRIEGPSATVTGVEAEFQKQIKEYLSTLKCEVLHVDARHSKHIIGKSGANVKRLKEETDVEISINEEGTTSTITIEGSPSSVASVKAELLELVNKLENEKELSVTIDTKLIVRLGRQKEFRENYPNLNISFPQQAGDKEVRIRGPGDDAKKCMEELRALARQLAQDNITIEVPIFKKYHRNIIGKNGANIRKIREDTNAKIDMPGEKDDSENIIITGKREGVMKAKEIVEGIQNSQESITQRELSIPSKFYTLLIGAGGRLIRSISEECGGVQIKFPDQSSNSDRVLVRGPKEDVDKAVLQLDETRKELELASFQDTVTAKQTHHKFLIGKNGSTVKRIRNSTGARIMFPSENDANPDTIVIMGKKEAIASAKAELELLIADIGNSTEDSMAVDPRHHRHFVMRSGEVIQRITEECGGQGTITISFPRVNAPDADKDKVVLKGPKEAIVLAKQKITDEVSSLESQVETKCVIQKRYHRTVMGTGGAKVQRVQSDFNVRIKFPDRNEPGTENGSEPAVNGEAEEPLPGDVITIVGQPEDCKAASQALQELVPITIEVSVPNEMHRSIIGKGGSKVRELMQEYDVRIDVPQQDLQEDNIRVSGAPANVEDARLALLDRIKEFENDKEDRALRSFAVTLEVDPEFHPKIIGRRGAVISKIREEFDVNVNLPKRGDENEHIITIMGYEDKANAAKEHILSLVNELKGRVREEVEIDSRVHRRLIGARGSRIRQLMDKFKVDIKFPQRTDDNPDLVIITGNNEDDVLDAKDEILEQSEQLMESITERETYRPPRPVQQRGGGAEEENGAPAEGFRVTGAPWSQQTPNTESITDFPSFGLGGEAVPRGPGSAAWGPRR